MKRKNYKHDIMTKQRIIKHKIKHFHHVFERVIHHNLNNCEVYAGESRLLMMIADNDNFSQRELAKKLGTSPASVGVSLKKLEHKGYISRTVADNDSRANIIQLTPKGDDFIENSHELFQKLDKETFEGFSDEEMNLLDNFMDRLHENLLKMLEDTK